MFLSVALFAVKQFLWFIKTSSSCQNHFFLVTLRTAASARPDGIDRHLRLYVQQPHVLELVLANWPSNMTRSKSRHLHIEGVVENIVMPRGLFQAELRARRIALHCAS